MIIQQATRSGLPLPEKIQNAPSILPGLELYYMGFLELTSSRAFTGFGVGPIPWSVIQQYSDSLGLDMDQTEAMHHHITALDTVYLKHTQKKKN